jgi:hypothetical protein
MILSSTSLAYVYMKSLRIDSRVQFHNPHHQTGNPEIVSALADASLDTRSKGLLNVQVAIKLQS